MISLVADRRQFLAIGHEGSAFGAIRAVKAEYLVVGACCQRLLGVVVRLVVLPDADALKADDRRFFILRQRHVDAAAFAVDAAGETDFAATVFRNRVVAIT